MAVRTRNDLARVMAPKMGMTHQESERYLKELIAEITKALKNGECALTNHNAMRVKFPLRQSIVVSFTSTALLERVGWEAVGYLRC